MTEEVKAGETPVEKTDGVTVVPAPEPIVSTVDYEAELAAKDAIIAKISEERSNYKRGMLKAKGKLKDDFESSDEETEEERIARLVDERISLTREAQALADREALIKKMAKENAELRTAVKNRSNMTPAGGSAGPESEKKNDNILSEDQLRDIKTRFPHWTDKEIAEFKKNLTR